MKKTLSLIILIVAFASILTCAVSARHYTDGGNDYYIYTARDIINAGLSVGDGLTYSYDLDEDNLGNDEVRYTLEDGVTYSDSFYANMTMPADEYFSAKEYPYVKIGYTNNIEGAAYFNFNFNMHTGSSAYSRHFFDNWTDLPNPIDTTGDSATGNFALVNTSGNWLFNATTDISEDDPHFNSFRFFPMNSTWKNSATSDLSGYAGQYFTIQYIAFFKDSTEAESFEFNKNDYIPQYDHRAFMFPSSNIDTKFRPDDNLTHAEALTAIANDKEDLSAWDPAGTLGNSFGIGSSDPMNKVVRYLSYRGYINENTERGNSEITVVELNALLTSSGYTPASTELSDTSTITRAQAAKYLCGVFGRNPDKASFDNISIGYFSDVPLVEAYDIETQTPADNEYYEYIMEAAYTHDPADYSASTAEKWNDAKDPYLHMAKADDVIIEDLENQFEVGRERILQTLSEYEIDPDAFVANVGTIYYVSSSEGDDANDGTSEDKPVKNLDTLHEKGVLRAGDAVLFKRGDEWRFGSYDITSGEFNEGKLPSDSAYYKYLFNAKNNITYSCYGADSTDRANGYTTKPKPKLYGSIFAGNESDWERVGNTNIWKYTKTLDIRHDVGNIVFFQKETPPAGAKQATEHPVGVFAPEEALEVYGQRIVKNVSDGSIMQAGRNKLVGNGVDTWTLDHATVTFDITNSDIGARFNDVIDQIKNNPANTGKNPDLIYFHNLKAGDESLASSGEISGYDDGDNYLYLYSENGNPGLLYDVELCTYGHAVRPANTNITIDNIAIVCTGGHGIGASSSTNLSVTNCELGWIGGAIQKITSSGISRYGNAIEIYGTANGYNVENCYMYQAFDCGPTVQITVKGPNIDTADESKSRYRYVQENILFKDNVLWEADLEVWLTSTVDNDAATDPGDATGQFYAALDNCVLTDNLVTGSGYGFSGYNHYKHDPCQFYGAEESKAKHINCYIMNNKFWGSKYQIVKAVPTSIKNNQGFHWVGNTIIQTYDDAHIFGILGKDLDNCTDSQTLNFSNDTLKKLFASKSMDSNDYMYLVVGEDPAVDYLPTEEEIKEVLMNIVAFSEDYRCRIESDIAPTFYYNEYRSSNKPVDFTAVSTVNGTNTASYYWTRLTQEDDTRIFLVSGQTYSAYPLGSNVYYQPIFVDTATEINVNRITGEILDPANLVMYDTDGDPLTAGYLTVNYYKPKKNATVGKDMLEVVYKDAADRPTMGDPYFGAGYTFVASDSNTENPMWTLTVAEEEFTVSYKNALKFNYMFPITQKVTIEEQTGTNDSDMPIINTIYAWNDTDYANFTASYEIPDGCEHVSHGVLLAKDAQLLLDVASVDGELSVSNGVIVGRVRGTDSNELVPIYTISKSLANQSVGVVWYGRAYVTYEKNGQFYTYISKDILSDSNARITETATAIVKSGTFGNREVYSPIIWNDEIIDG